MINNKDKNMSCSQCGASGVNGICSMCYGDIDYNTDNFYEEFMTKSIVQLEENKEEELLKQDIEINDVLFGGPEGQQLDF